MRAYQIKVTYMEGPHTGKTYVMTKGGYVASDTPTQFMEECYEKLGTAKAVCSRYFKSNELNRRLERNSFLDRAYPIYSAQTFEPIEVNVCGC